VCQSQYAQKRRKNKHIKEARKKKERGEKKNDDNKKQNKEWSPLPNRKYMALFEQKMD
jgi:hypothetical protein